MMNLKGANAFLLAVSCFCSTAQHGAKRKLCKANSPCRAGGICPLRYLKVKDTNIKGTRAIR